MRLNPVYRRALEILAFGAVPLVGLCLALSVYSEQGRLALDFHSELYTQAELVRAHEPAFDPPGAYLEDRSNLVWPIAAVLPALPLTLVGPDVADWLATLVTIATLFGALLTLSVRDWRIYGVVLLWPATIEAIQTANASLPLTLLVALMWRYREQTAVAGLALGYAVAVKLFLWPLVVWQALIGRRRTALLASAIAAVSLLLLAPFVSVLDYGRVLRELARTFEHDAYTPFALLTDVGTPDAAARAMTAAVGLAVLGLAWRRRSLGLAIAAALCLSPIVWRHFFVLLLVPLALSRPRFDVLWLVPLGMWVGDGTFNGAPWQTAVVVGLAALVFVRCETSPRTRDAHSLSPGPVHA